MADKLKGLVLTAAELRQMTEWPDALIEDYLSMFENILVLDTSSDKKEDKSNKDTDPDLTANSNIKYPSQKAVKCYVDKTKNLFPPYKSYIYGVEYVRYSGVSNNSSITDLSGLTPEISAEFAGQYTFGTSGYKYIVYRSEIGLATTFIDENQMPVPFEDVSVLVVDDVNYNVHRSTNVLNNELTLVVY